MFSNNQPLWLPKGSVRAILAMGSMASTVAMIFTATPIPDWWAGIATAINAAYFVQKAVSSLVNTLKNGRAETE